MPEELPVVESLELINELKKMGYGNTKIFCNKVFVIRASENEIKNSLENKISGQAVFGEFLLNHIQEQRKQLYNLSQALGPIRQLPYVLKNKSKDVIAELAAHMGEKNE
jgi:hypothetical protein